MLIVSVTIDFSHCLCFNYNPVKYVKDIVLTIKLISIHMLRFVSKKFWSPQSFNYFIYTFYNLPYKYSYQNVYRFTDTVIFKGIPPKA